MTISDQARNAAISLEAKKDRLVQRQSSDWSITFTVQDSDMDSRFTSARMGTRYAMVLVEIGDDELPVQKEGASAKPGQIPPKSDRVKRDWRQFPPSQQAGIRCEDAIFSAFLRENYPDEWREAQAAKECIYLICAVDSRAKLNDGPSRVLWHQLDEQFSGWKALENA